ncbi:hypothetical protein [Nocardioides sp. KR10-350]|uniref:hypothetical protein n=1 Tax=Nocardioides cheoyonin TaxID=3156615 RepID=UPI0032B36944
MSERKLPRPSQVTLAGWLIVGGSLAALVTVYEQLSRLHSLDTRESIQKTLSEPPFDAVGISVPTVLDVMHVLALVTGACAAAAIVLGWHALQRHKASRIALTVLAVPLLLSGMASGGFFSTIVAVAVVLLWVPRSRDWFDGREPEPPAPGSGEQATDPSGQSVAQPPPPPSSGGQATDRPHQTVPQPPPSPGWPQQVPQLTQPIHPAAPTRRPPAVTWAAVLTWILSGLGGLLLVATAATVLIDPAGAFESVREQDPDLVARSGVTQDLLVASVVTMAALGVLFSIACAVAALLAWRRVRWSWVTLVCLEAAAVAVLLFATVIAAPFVVALAGAVVALALLLRPEARLWFSSARPRAPRDG